MTKRLGLRLGLVLFVALLAVGPVVLTTQAGVSIGGAHWARTKNPFTLRVGDNVSGHWDRNLRRAANDWGKSRVVKMRVVPGSTSPQSCRPRNNQVQVCSARYGDNGWLGLTRIWVNKQDHILRAAVQMNDFYFDSGYYAKPKAMQHTMCHELGHALGLGHINGKTCMNDNGSSIFRDTRPTARDFNNLDRLYRHRDRPGEVRSAATDDGDLDATTIPELPDADTFDPSESVRSESTGDGGRVITFITWIDESKSTK